MRLKKEKKTKNWHLRLQLISPKNKMGDIRVYTKTEKILAHQKLKLQNYMLLK